MASRQQRTELTIEDKLEIIKSLKNNKCSRKDLQERYKVSKHTINRILSREDELKTNRNTKMRRIRSGNNRLVDEAVSKWYRSMQEQNIFVNGPLLRQQAVRFARKMNNHTFEANNGWLWRWQQKEKVKFNSSCSGRRERTKAANALMIASDTNELPENPSLQSFGDSDKNLHWQPLSNQLEQSGISQFEINVKEEVADAHRNPFEADVVFDIESDEQEQGGYDNEASRNEYPSECVNVEGDGEEIQNYQDEISLDHESLQDNNFHRQSIEIKEEQNGYRTIIDSEEESEKYRLAKKRKGKNENEPQDIYSIYGDYIARRLRASANERENYEIYIAQHNIDDVIFNLSMGSYARPPLSRSYENSSFRNSYNIEPTRLKQPHESIIKEKQTFTSTTTPRGKTNDFQDYRSASNVDKSIPTVIFHEFLSDKT